MPYFLVQVEGRGIDCAIEGVSESIIGFFTTRKVRATEWADVHALAIESVLGEWRPGGQYATSNRGGLPQLSVADAWQIGWLKGAFGREPKGYCFYSRDD